MERSSGILMPIYSLPSEYGIGTMGGEAYSFAEFLKRAGQKFWQVLPLNPTSYGDSPYQSFSAFAGNPYLIDIQLLIEDGLISAQEASEYDFGSCPRYIDYGLIYESRFRLLEKVKRRGYIRDFEAVSEFACENRAWLPDYALFMALKRHFNMRPWLEWDDGGARMRKPESLEHYRTLLKEDIELFTYIQFLFFKQWSLLKGYINGLGIKIIGDLPIYVALDSADVWAEPQQFQLDADNFPMEVAGVPPDYFSEFGQLWGNPLYDWTRMSENGYEWWLNRIDGARRLYDVIRIDHFRGIESYWAVPYGEKTAKNGRWIKGPGMDFVNAVKDRFQNLEIIAEDLGFLTPEVRKLLADSGFPGMKVLEFAFDSKKPSDYLPHNHVQNCVCYTGSHDNSPIMLWKDEAAEDDIAFAVEYLGLNDAEGFNWGIIRGGMSSVAKLFVAQMQDCLGLGNGHRTNTPGTYEGNWRWRMLKGEASPELAEKLRRYAFIYGRA